MYKVNAFFEYFFVCMYIQALNTLIIMKSTKNNNISEILYLHLRIYRETYIEFVST